MWLRDMPPEVQTLIEFVYQRSPELAIEALGHAVGEEIAYGEEHAADSLAEYLDSAAGDAPRGYQGAVSVGQIWSEPANPEPGVDYRLLWEESNLGDGPTGAYETMVRTSSGNEVLCPFDSLDAAGVAERSAPMQGEQVGVTLIQVMTPWFGSENPSSVVRPAGVVMTYERRIAFGARAGEELEKAAERAQLDIELAETVQDLRGVSEVTAASEMLGFLMTSMQKMAALAPSMTEVAELAEALGTIEIENLSQAVQIQLMGSARLIAEQVNDVSLELYMQQDVGRDHPVFIETAGSLMGLARIALGQGVPGVEGFEDVSPPQPKKGQSDAVMAAGGRPSPAPAEVAATADAAPPGQRTGRPAASSAPESGGGPSSAPAGAGGDGSRGGDVPGAADRAGEPDVVEVETEVAGTAAVAGAAAGDPSSAPASNGGGGGDARGPSSAPADESPDGGDEAGKDASQPEPEEPDEPS
jgi:hypothetical protein